MSTAGGDVRGEGSASRRGERLLRSWLKHERLRVAVALAERKHHALRGHMRREEVERVSHHAPRGQNLPPPGTR